MEGIGKNEGGNMILTDMRKVIDKIFQTIWMLIVYSQDTLTGKTRPRYGVLTLMTGINYVNIYSGL